MMTISFKYGFQLMCNSLISVSVMKVVVEATRAHPAKDVESYQDQVGPAHDREVIHLQMFLRKVDQRVDL